MTDEQADGEPVEVPADLYSPFREPAPVVPFSDLPAPLLERNGAIWRMYLRGATYEAIGAKYGISAAKVGSVVREIRRSLPPLDVAEIKRLDLERLDAILNKAMRAAEKHGDKDAIRSVLSIMERRAKLLGLDSPTKVETEGTVRYVIEGLDAPADVPEAGGALE